MKFSVLVFVILATVAVFVTPFALGVAASLMGILTHPVGFSLITVLVILMFLRKTSGGVGSRLVGVNYSI